MPAARLQGLLFGVAAVALGWGLAKPSPRQPNWIPALLVPGFVLALLAAVWCGLLVGRVVVRDDRIRVFGVNRSRSFPLSQVRCVVAIAATWPARGAPVVLPGVHVDADYLRVVFTDGGAYDPPALCSLTGCHGRSDSARSVADEVNRLIEARRESQD